MGNFFQVTCPFLFRLDTVAYFPLLRGRHSYEAVARIRDTTQLLLDVHTGDALYLHPLKVWNRYSAKMFLPHSYDQASGAFRTLEDGVALSRYYQLLEEEETEMTDQNYDSHDRFFSMAREAYRRGTFDLDTEQQILESTLTRDSRLQEMIKKYFSPKDYFLIRDRMAGSGSIGGKPAACCLPARSSISIFLNTWHIRNLMILFISVPMSFLYLYRLQQLLGNPHCPAERRTGTLRRLKT